MELFLHAVIIAAVPLIFAAMGELITERSGLLNLGVEGMMLMGAVAAFAAAQISGSSLVGVFAGAMAGAALAALFCVLALSLAANQAASGLALTIFGVGMSGLIGEGYVGQKRDPLPRLDLDIFDKGDPLWVVLGHDIMTFGALALTLAVWVFLTRTRAGLSLRAVGDNHDSAHAMGLKALRTRWMAALFGGACAGLGGAYLSLAITPLWGEEMTAGRGWIALALVVFAAWRPGLVLVGAFIFAAAGQLHLYAQNWSFTMFGLTDPFKLPAQFWAMGPYVATILALALISAGGWGGRSAPACLGRAFRPPR